VYDLKLEILDGEETVAYVWDEEWKSAYYYLKEFVEAGDSKDVKVKISKAGNYDCVMKLRKGEVREFFDFEIEILEREESEENIEEDFLENGLDDIDLSLVSNEEVKEEIIVLNSVSEDPEELVYILREQKVVELLPYVFSFVLIVILFLISFGKI
jgi:hypothetical protein